MKPIDPRILANAFVSPGASELAWRRSDLFDAMRAIANSGRAILGGEVWVVRSKDGNWHGLIPSRDGSPPGVWSWDTTARRVGEEWQEYCERTLAESQEETSRMKVEAEAPPEVLPLLWFNVTFDEPRNAEQVGAGNGATRRA